MITDSLVLKVVDVVLTSSVEKMEIYEDGSAHRDDGRLAVLHLELSMDYVS